MAHLELKEVIDHRAARVALLEMIGRVKVVCPQCGSTATAAQIDSIHAGGRARCAKCTRWYSWSSDTIFMASNLNSTQLYIIALCAQTGISEKQTAMLAQCRTATAKQWMVTMEQYA